MPLTASSPFGISKVPGPLVPVFVEESPAKRIPDKFSKRFAEFAAKSEALEFRKGDFGRHVPEGIWQEWATSCQGLIRAVFGEDSPHYTNFTGAAEDCAGYESQIQALQGIFRSTMEDFEGGYV